MLEPIGRSRSGWRSRTPAWWGMAAVGIVALGSTLWLALREKEPSGEINSEAAQALTVSTQGMVLVPIQRADGRADEPLVLVPVTNGLRAAAPAGRSNDNPFAAWLPSFDERVLAAQVALARRGISSGSLDGVMGGQTRAALRAFQQAEGLPASGSLDAATLARLGTNAAATSPCTVTAEDLARLLPVGQTWLAKSQQERLDYESILELLAERSSTNPKLVRALNPRIDWDHVAAGTVVQWLALDFAPPAARAALLRISLSGRTLEAFDAEGHLLAHFPCSIAARVEKRPVGDTLQIVAIAPQPNYTFDPAVFPESAEARELGVKKLILPPGPNNPVGTVWFSLDKPGYGIHGTPRPEDVGRTESHGCFRLANWNAEYLLKLVGVGTSVQVEP